MTVGGILTYTNACWETHPLGFKHVVEPLKPPASVGVVGRSSDKAQLLGSRTRPLRIMVNRYEPCWWCTPPVSGQILDYFWGYHPGRSKTQLFTHRFLRSLKAWSCLPAALPNAHKAGNFGQCRIFHVQVNGHCSKMIISQIDPIQEMSHVFSGVQSISNNPVLLLYLNWFRVLPKRPSTLTQAHLISPICRQYSPVQEPKDHWCSSSLRIS